MKNTPMALLLAACALWSPACSGEGSLDGDNPNDCGAVECDPENPLDALDPSTLISNLNKDELVAFCEQRKSFHSEFLTLQTDPSLDCTAAGLDLRFQEEADIATCEATRDACILEANEEGTPSFNLIECLPFQVSTLDMMGCNATLGEFNACSEALLTQAKRLIETLNCNITIEEAAVFQAQDNASLPAECAVITAECPPIQAEFEAGAE